MMKWLKENWLSLIIIFFITLFFIFPYIVLDGVPIEHDTFFHLSRIEQYSIALKNGYILPAITPYTNGNFGYASPLFYSDILLFPFALLHALGLPLTIIYRTLIFFVIYFTALSMYILMKHITNKSSVSYLASIAYIFSNYHISDVYVRGALGETMAFIALPIVLLGIKELFFDKNEAKWRTLFFGLLLLVLCHNLTFLFGVVLVVIGFFVGRGFSEKKIIVATSKTILFAFLCSAFYTLPMLEQLSSQQFILNIYASNFDLSTTSMTLSQYFVNKTIFGISSNTIDINSAMVVNVGYFLTFVPLLYLFLPKDKHSSFLTFLFICGYVAFLLPSSLLPWKSMQFLSILQFPWRLNTIACLMLSVVSAYSICNLFDKFKYVPIICMVLLLVEGFYHIHPVLNRDFMMKDTMTWQNVQNGDLIDPYYSADYMRIELAGGDYLPINHPNFKEYAYEVVDIQGNIQASQLERTYDKLSISFDEEVSGTFIAPLTYYKGYQVYDSNNQKLETYESDNGLVSFNGNNIKEVYCVYHNTPLRNLSIVVSIVSILGYFFLQKKL